jgi:hypothetical protein
MIWWRPSGQTTPAAARGPLQRDAGFVFLDVLVNLERIAEPVLQRRRFYTVSLNDAEAAEMQHDYIKHLHQGENEQFNREFRAARTAYFESCGPSSLAHRTEIKRMTA